MKLLTQKIIKKMPKIYSTEKVDELEKLVVARFFSTGANWTWYVVEGEQEEDGEWLFYGLVDGFELEWGYFTLSELESTRTWGVAGIERDKIFTPKKIKEIKELEGRV